MTFPVFLSSLERLNVLISPDKFKGTLPAAGVAAALARGWRRVRPGDRLERLPMTDGGDGFGETFGALLEAKPRTALAVDAAHRRCRSRWWFAPQRRTALIESARVIGLAMLPAGRFHPFELDTFGLGLALRSAAAAGAQRCLVGLGGSATNDAGFGLARALGWEFIDRSGVSIESWTRLTELARVHPPRRRRWFRELLVAVDVTNPLLGRRGASQMYGPQKGLRPHDFALAERALGRLASVIRHHTSVDFARVPGAGAAGGLGFGFLAFLGAELVPGFELFAQQTNLERRLRRADVVITGEGALDRSTLMGKGVGEVASRCRKLRKPCIAVAGSVVEPDQFKRSFLSTSALTDLTSLAQARSRPAAWLEKTAARLARDWNPHLRRKPMRLRSAP